MPNYYFIGINKIIRMLQKNHSLLGYGDSYGRNGCFGYEIMEENYQEASKEP
ncbi:hypothetical protein [Clostridium estertheticum]|uniref:hypothetical protein n=1 Tax=Clostridium estertheticum TaxID=238834 RepID=UPI0027146C5F|nr:hypothetical protein [Clostridium estertheticum]WLC79923.1 hypothetical protein KTC98_00715 [Clostridium estertheticum]